MSYIGCSQTSNTFNSNVIFPKECFKTPFLQFIRAFEVARNGQPKITGICAFEFETECVSKTIKSTGK